MDLKKNQPVETEHEHLSHRPLPETWAASPLNPYSNETRATQEKVLNAIYSRTEAICSSPELHIPATVADMLHASTVGDFSRESARNYDSFRFLPETVEPSPDLIEGYQNALAGYAEPKESLQLIAGLKIPSVELAKLSHIGGIMIDQLSIMRNNVSEAIIELGGENTTPETEYNHIMVVATNSMIFCSSKEHQETCCVSMKRKRTLGFLPDGTIIKERSRFLLRADDESPLDESIKQAVRKINITKASGDSDGGVYKWLNERMFGGIKNFEYAVRDALNNDLYSIIIPLSTTIYAYNSDIESFRRQEKEEIKRQQKAAFRSRQNPEFIRQIERDRKNERIRRQLGATVANF